MTNMQAFAGKGKDVVASAVAAAEPSPRKLDAWCRLSEGAWPVELGPAWLRAEWARITRQSYVTVHTADECAQAAASWLLLEGTEERRGYGVFDLLLDSHMDEAMCDAMLTSDEDAQRYAALRERAGALSSVRTATITTTSSYFPGVVWDNTLDGAMASRAARGTIEAVLAHAREQGASFAAVVNVPEEPPFDTLRHALEALEFVRVTSAPDSSLKIPAGGIDAYLQNIRRSFRQVVRKEMRVFAAAVDRVAVYGADRLLEPDLLELLDARYSKYGHATTPASIADRLSRVASIDGLRVLVVERAGKVAGFAALVPDVTHRRLIPRLSACSINDVYIYFNLIFYELIRLGAEWGFTELALGSTAYRAKLLRGAHLRPRATFLRALDDGYAQQLEEALAFRNEVEEARLRAIAEIAAP
jgi:hypothetical protein